MLELINWLKRNGLWIILSIIALLILKPAIPEWKTFSMIVCIESIAISLSGLAAYGFTKIDFINQKMGNILGFIFLGVHICVGLIVMGVYIASFSN